MKRILLSMAIAIASVSTMLALDNSGTCGTCDWTFDSTTGLLTIRNSEGVENGELKINNPLLSPFVAKDEIKEVMIEEGVFEIGTGAFYGCKNLKKITFPSTIGMIGFSDDYSDDVLLQMPFAACIGLETLIFKSRYSPDINNAIYERTTAVEMWGIEDPSKVNLYLYDESIRSFLDAGWGVFHICSLPAVAEGTFGEGFSWKLSEQGKLTVMGQGAMPDFVTVDKQPWVKYIVDVKELVVAEGITHIGAAAFAFGANIKNAYLPATLKSIGENAFNFCNGLEEVICAATEVPTLDKYALPTFLNDEKIDIYVWEYMANDFKADAEWGKQNIKTFGADTEWLAFTDDVDVDLVSENAIYLLWPQVAGATVYVIRIVSEDPWFGYEITIAADGKVTYVKKSPGLVPQYDTDDPTKGFGFEINGLEPGKNYTVTVTAKDETKVLATYTKTITTITTDVEKVAADKNTPLKFMHNGQLMIRYNQSIYNMLGAEVK